jgi:hypothetical protein
LKSKALYIFFFFAIVNQAIAQDPITIKLTEKDGLPDAEFYDIIEDKKGFIWLAADKGLFRYDGNQYQLFTQKDKRGSSVFGLKFDLENNLWCNNISGQFFKIRKDKLELFLDLKNELKGELAEFTFLDGKIIISTVNTITSVDLKTKERKDLLSEISPNLKKVKSPFKFKKKIFFAINDKIYSFFKSKFEQITLNGIKEYSNQSLLRLFTFKDELYLNCYFADSNLNTFYKVNKNMLTPVLLPEILTFGKIVKIKECKKELWFCTSNGIVILKSNSENNFAVKSSLFKDDFITNFIEDSNKTTFISTLNNGIYIVPNLEVKAFENVVPNGAISVTEKIAENTIAIGTTKGGLLIKNLENNTVPTINLDLNSKVTALLFLKEFNTLLISLENSSYIYELNSRKLVKSGLFNNAKDLKAIDNSNRFIYCTYHKAMVFEIKNTALSPVKELVISRAYKSFYDETEKKIYVSYVDNVIEHYNNLENKILTYQGKSIIAKDICKTNDGILWIATFNEGVLGFKKDVFLTKLNSSNGLLSNTIQGLKTDGPDLWIITDLGVQLYNSTSKKIHSSLINKNNPLGNIKDIIIKKTSVLFTTRESLFEMNKKGKDKVYVPKAIYIKSFTINEKDTLVKNNYLLPYNKNRIKFTFHVNGYYPNEELLFDYQLSGLNSKWIPIEKNTNFINFNSLPSEAYTFQIRCKNSTTNNYVSTKLSFKINQPYWEKWWFFIALLVVSFGLVILFYKNKLAVKEKEKELVLKKAKFENELAILKLENLKSQMNPHFIFNALNSIQEYIVLNQRNLASSYLSKFADLIRSYLDHSSKGYISLQEEIECLDIYLQLEKLRFEDKFTYEITSSEGEKNIKIPTMLIQPYVENALKHGLLHKKENRQLKIDFQWSENEEILHCTIIDNGVGREKAAALRKTKHKPFAIKATQNRLELLNFGKERKIGVTIDDLYNSDKEAIGTQVTLLIPILK